ncbi:L-type lectin-domain containing receptor kinase IX.1-like [Ziziphus jujuba]|uniref:non-specific serine/threonine protein kinase n=1 Tax=Ziziphus jujuba TaxID=326968 RepID=A0A6P6GD67_ZIZJJ|nr:L-type lectin-domain containing receptor kinase IX.1-like [Ziziphus jujuba]
MAVSNPCPYLFRITLFLFPIINAESFFYNFNSSGQSMDDILPEGDAIKYNDGLQLTKNRLDSPIKSSSGRASYDKKVKLWDAGTNTLTDFTTHFSFIINTTNGSWGGDGMALFIAPFDARLPPNSQGSNLGLFSAETAFNKSANHIVAVEFDTYQNLDWDQREGHIGININSIISETYVLWNSSMKNGSTANAWVTYNSTTKNLRVFLTYAKNPEFHGESSLSYTVDFREWLPEYVRFGFSASTGSDVEIHNLLSWSFNSTLEDDKKESKARLWIGLAVGLSVSGCGLALFWFVWRRRARRNKEIKEAYDASMDVEFQKGTGPKRFMYHELSRATNNFAHEGKLGEGGFGGVYKGLLAESNMEVAVKRVSSGSKQGKKEYISEVKIISRLRHRNLVQLIGWCHEQGEFLLVYEFLPNGSLDSHLFRRKVTLTWTLRHKIALGLASVLLYLHEEWEQCVVHRDIKSSNVMLDSNFNAKLGDFGLARLVDHELGSQTTVLAGTMGYLAPECVTTGRASKESDVYSFGVVALEICCGRRPVEQKADPSEVRLVEWVWNLYGQGQILEAVDKGLNMDFDERQVECLLVVGLWCCHPDPAFRPSIKQVINVLNFETPLPSLPAKLPVPMYFAPPLQMCSFSSTSSGPPHTGLVTDRTQCSCSSCTTYSSKSTGSSEALLKSHTAGI